MQITVELPNDLAQHDDPAREAVEAVAIAGYRAGSLTAYEARRLLGFQTRFEFEGFLKERGIYDHAYDVADLEQDIDNLARVLGKTSLDESPDTSSR